MLESEIEEKLIQKIEKYIPNARCIKMTVPGLAGMPDRLILVPGGSVVFVELKAPGKKERPLQIRVQAHLRKLGFTVFSAVDSAEKIEAVVQCCEVLAGDHNE